jgi:hypothetical protein
MSSHSPAAEAGPSAQQVEAVVREYEALRAALSRARWARLALLVAVLAFVVGACAIFISFVGTLASPEYREKVIALLQSKMGDNNNMLVGEVQKLVQTATPVVAKAFTEQAKKDLPLFLQGVEKERDAFAANLQEKAGKSLTDHYHKILAKHQETLRAEFPKIEDGKIHDRMATNLGLAFDRMVKKYMADDMNTQLIALYDAWDHFPAAETTPDSPMEDQFIGSLFEMLQSKMTELPNASASQMPVTAPPGAARMRRGPDAGTDESPKSKAAEPTKSEAPKAEAPKGDAPKPETSKAEAPK